MKNILQWLIVLCSFYQIISPQIIVVRKNSLGYYGPLSEEDISDERISQILWKYTWPSCIAQDLTKEEQDGLLQKKKEKDGLLERNKENREECFIREKIKKISPDLDVVFVPNTLYELFIIKNNSIKLEVQFNIDLKMFVFLQMNKNTIERIIPTIKEISNQNNPTNKKNLINEDNQIDAKSSKDLSDFLKSQINQIYNDINKFFFKKENKYILSLENHKIIVKWISSLYNDMHAESGSDISNFIYEKRDEIKNKLLSSKTLSKVYDDLLLNKDDDNIILQSIELDYKARRLNKGLLFRGSSFVNQVSIFRKPTESTESTESIEFLYSTLNKTYNHPFSISFGNSLFAGYNNDLGACSYNIMNKDSSKKVVGYALFIDKLNYVRNYNSNLFFISALSVESALFAQGEWFHSRTKPAILMKTDKQVYVVGLQSFRYGGILDPLGIFLITRDPYRQAKLFAEYVAENIALFTTGDANTLTEKEIAELEKVSENQKLLLKEYKFIDFLNRKVRERREGKLVLASKSTRVALEDEERRRRPWITDEKPQKKPIKSRSAVIPQQSKKSSATAAASSYN